MIPTAGRQTSVDLQPFVQAGCTIQVQPNVAIMKSPIGSADFCETFVAGRVAKAAVVVRAVGELPDRHCALYLLRYQIAKLDFMARTTPSATCKGALQSFDDEVQAAYDRISGRQSSSDEWRQLVLPTRHGGAGLRSVVFGADAAYYASRAARRSGVQRSMKAVQLRAWTDSVRTAHSEQPLKRLTRRSRSLHSYRFQKMPKAPGSRPFWKICTRPSVKTSRRLGRGIGIKHAWQLALQGALADGTKPVLRGRLTNTFRTAR